LVQVQPPRPFRVLKMTDIWKQFDYFPSSVYRLDKPEFINTILNVANEYLEDVKSKRPFNDIYRTYQTDNFSFDPRVSEFCVYIAQTSWNILSSQGYKMDDKETFVSEFWMHHYLRTGSMDNHVHASNSYITGFYILETDDNGCEIVLHDPRPGKVQMGMYSGMSDEIRNSSDRIFFKPVPGMMLFTNSWLPHSFTRNESKNPFSFIHFNVNIRPYIPTPPPAEVI
jgi:uncharacterized protein (TIGR02466 family)